MHQVVEVVSGEAPLKGLGDGRVVLLEGQQAVLNVGEGAKVLEKQKALEQWVEHGKAPAHIAATKFTNTKRDDGVAFARPLCPYPQEARYSGHGDTKDGVNFTCVDGHRYPKPLTAETYRR